MSALKSVRPRHTGRGPKHQQVLAKAEREGL